MSTWQSVERPGYLGKHRDERYQYWDQQHGLGNWRLAWQIGEHCFDIEGAIVLYEDAYWRFLSQNRLILRQLITEASDVYDDSPTNVDCGLRYFPQETDRTHLQDVAIRRCLVRFGDWFHGPELIQIRDRKSSHPLGLTLSPGQVPFHMHWLIGKPELEGWWLPGSVESFYQSNRWLQVKASE